MLTIKCPKCDCTDFTECSNVPTEIDIVEWSEVDGQLSVETFGDTHSYFEAEVLEDKPFKCNDCAEQFTTEELIIIRE